MLGLPSGTRGCLFDLDGVITRTAGLHAAAWKEMFDGYLRTRQSASFTPFDIRADYLRYIDGKPRYEGVRSFLASRGIQLPAGNPSDAPGAETVAGLGNRKNELVLRLIRERGVDTYAGSVAYVRAAQSLGLRRAVVSSSKNCREILAAAKLEDLFEARIDGELAAREGLPGKPAPDTYLAAAHTLGEAPERLAVFEDALSGVEAGRAGGFSLVVGVDRSGQRDALLEHGADLVVEDLSELLSAESVQTAPRRERPSRG